jgi:hypothetical protein
MAETPLTPDERARLGDFIFQLVQGKAKLGLGSLGMIALYDRARAEGLAVTAILGESPEVLHWAAALMHQHASRIPTQAIDILKLVVAAAERAPKPLPETQLAQTMPAGLDDDV